MLAKTSPNLSKIDHELHLAARGAWRTLSLTPFVINNEARASALADSSF